MSHTPHGHRQAVFGEGGAAGGRPGPAAGRPGHLRHDALLQHQRRQGRRDHARLVSAVRVGPTGDVRGLEECN